MLKTFSTELTGEEKELLSTYEQFYRALEEGIHVPETEAQQHFIDVCHGRAFASTPHEIVWLKVKATAHAKPEPATRPVDEQVERAIKDEIKSKKDSTRANQARAYISSTF